VTRSSSVSAHRPEDSDDPAGAPPAIRAKRRAASGAALRESEARLRALQNEFAHLARVHELGEMAAAVAHEINQPLTAITNYLNAGRLAMRESTSDALDHARRSMALAAEQGMRAGAIIRTLRAFACKGDGARRTEAADALVESVMALALLGAEAAGIEVVREPAGSGAMIDVNSVQIQQVLMNLLRNAVEALMLNPPGEERRLAVVTQDLPREGIVLFRIEDSGPGIEPEMQARLFQPFATSKVTGMGMGLAVCQRIVEAHGGTIEVESGEGRGAAFTIRLPRAHV
jgi:two-component system sensor kinase FixL